MKTMNGIEKIGRETSVLRLRSIVANRLKDGKSVLCKVDEIEEVGVLRTILDEINHNFGVKSYFNVETLEIQVDQNER
jgi:hypothetical protein